MTTLKEAPLTGLRKAAVLMVLLGDEAASSIYSTLPPFEVQRLTQEITELGYVSGEIADKVLQEYQQLSLTQEYLAQGGPEYAENLLIKSFGEQEAKAILEQVILSQEESAANFDFLQKADPEILTKFIEDEHPQTIALILAHLGVKSSSALLTLLSREVQGKVVERLAEMRQFSSELANEVSLVLYDKMSAIGKQSRRSYGGIKVVAELLNSIEQTYGKSILDTIEQSNPELSVEIRNVMFTFEDLLNVDDHGIRELLSQMDKRTLAIALKGAQDELRAHIFHSMSSRAVLMLQEDMEILGPMRSRDVMKAQQETVNLARKLEAQGKLVLKGGQDEEYIV
ncbi:MAG: flagellar motor switch protein FliG [Acidobacteria bacterium]|nr:flagellar motor switch protein FliG [Acidobacteriota bacterium]